MIVETYVSSEDIQRIINKVLPVVEQEQITHTAAALLSMVLVTMCPYDNSDQIFTKLHQVSKYISELSLMGEESQLLQPGSDTPTTH